MRTAIAAALILLIPNWDSASPTHSDDYLLIDGEGHYVRADPLNSYLSNYCDEKRLRAYVENFCEPYWPNYTRYWEVRTNRLYLVKIETDDHKKYPLDLLFNNYDGSAVMATWFSGIMSYRLDESPVIQLNHEYFEKEQVIEFLKGVKVRRFVINHRDRWISYARRIMDKYRPLEGKKLDFSDPALRMKDFWEDVFSIITNPKEEEKSVYYPEIQIDFNADLEAFHPNESDRELKGYELLKTIVEQTHSVLDVSISNRVVRYEINGTKPPAENKSRDLHPVENEEQKAPAE